MRGARGFGTHSSLFAEVGLSTGIDALAHPIAIYELTEALSGRVPANEYIRVTGEINIWLASKLLCKIFEAKGCNFDFM